MEKQILVNGKILKYTLRSGPKNKRLKFSINYGGDFVVSAPRFLSPNLIEEKIIQKSNWIFSKINQLKDVKKPLSKKENNLLYEKHKQQALNISIRKVEEFNKIYNFKFNKINIRNQKTRWGSCSTKGNLNFNYKIVFLPEDLADYLVVHEICHLGEFNHSKRFWGLVSRALPDYKKLKMGLKNVAIEYR